MRKLEGASAMSDIFNNEKKQSETTLRETTKLYVLI